MNTFYPLLSIFFLIFFSAACDENGDINNREITGTGPVVSETLDLASSNKISNTRVGNVMAYEMEIGDCMVDLSGVGDIKVHVSTSLDVSLTGVGDVYYRGNPSITSSVTGVGQLINDNP